MLKKVLFRKSGATNQNVHSTSIFTKYGVFYSKNKVNVSKLCVILLIFMSKNCKNMFSKKICRYNAIIILPFKCFDTTKENNPTVIKTLFTVFKT